jgi:hypothetical protein
MHVCRLLNCLLAAIGITVVCSPIRSAEESSVAQTAKPTARTSLSPFGIGGSHARNWGAAANESWIPQMAAIGITNTRTINSGWSEVEPAAGKWRWDALDKQMKYLEEQKVSYGGILIGNPKWTKNHKPGSLPEDIEGWSKYVTETVKHCKGRVKYWEVWNEPPNGTGKDQTPADYAKLVAAAYKAAKAADPDCLIGLAAKSAHINYLDQVIAAGARGHFDYVTLHPYEVGGGVISHPGSEPIYLNINSTLRKMLAVRDPEKVNCPIIFTELGFAAEGKESHKLGDFTTNEVQAHAVVKYYTMGIAQGIDCIQWFEGRDGDSGPLGLISAKGEKRPAYTAMAQMIEHLGKYPTYLGWLKLNDKHYGFVFAGAKGTVLATWASSLGKDEVDFGQSVEIVDPLTGNVTKSATHALTIAPIFVLGVPEKLLSLAKKNKDKPFNYGSDIANAKSVSVTYGEKNVEEGLHTKSAETVAADVVGYGGNARSGSVPGGSVFTVDPSFLCYTTEPIEISVEVRRNEANDNAGFKLVYESTTGYKNLGWYTVPDNKKWHTIKWKITDPQFVNMWGYNFSLNSDGPKFSKYYIKSVTVTKLGKDSP